MGNEKVLELVGRIEEDFRELQAITGDDHISAFLIGGSFALYSYEGEERKLDIFKMEANNE